MQIRAIVTVLQEVYMIRAAIIFFALALLTVLIGSYGVVGVSVEMGKTVAMIFLALAVLSYVGSLVTGKKNQIP